MTRINSYRAEQIIKAFVQNPNLLPALNRSLEALHTTGLFEFLREQGKVPIASTTEQAALLGAESVGYQRAIEDLMFFREKYLDPHTPQELPPVDYGAYAQLLNAGDITEDEADALRTGRKPNYPKPSNSSSSVSNGTGNERGSS